MSAGKAFPVLAVAIILASSLCVPFGIPGSDADIDKGTASSPLKYLRIDTPTAANETFCVMSGGAVEVSEAEGLEVTRCTLGFGLSVKDGGLSGTLRGTGTIKVELFNADTNEDLAFWIHSILYTGAADDPLDSLSCEVEESAGKTFYVRMGGHVDIGMSNAENVSVSPSGCGLSLSGTKAEGAVSGTSTITISGNGYFEPLSGDAFSIAIVPVASGQGVEVQTGNRDSPLASLDVGASDAAGKTFYVRTGGAVAIDMSDAENVSVSPSGCGLSLVGTEVWGTVSGASAITITGDGHFRPLSTDRFIIVIIPTGGGQGTGIQTGSMDEPLDSLSVNADDAAGMTFYVRVGGSVSVADVSDDSVSFTVESVSPSDCGLSVGSSGLSGTLSRACTVNATGNADIGGNFEILHFTIIAVDSGSSGAFAHTIEYYDRGELVGTQTESGGQPYMTVTMSQVEPARSGWTFTGWSASQSGSASGWKNGSRVDVGPTPLKVYASWGRTVTYDANGGTMDGDSTAIVLEGKTLTLRTDAYRDGYSFDGWYDARDGGSLMQSPLSPPGDMVLYAHWTKAPDTALVVAAPPDVYAVVGERACFDVSVSPPAQSVELNVAALGSWSPAVDGSTVSFTPTASGMQVMTVTASADGYSSGIAVVKVHVDDVLRFVNEPVASCRITGASR